jgi:hypothetical protein
LWDWEGEWRKGRMCFVCIYDIEPFAIVLGGVGRRLRGKMVGMN